MCIRSISLLLSAALLSIGCSRTPSNTGEAENPRKASNAPVERDTRSAAAEFCTGKDGRPLLVSVVWNGEPLIFVLDTGAPRTGFDSSLKSRLGDPVGRITLQTSAGLLDCEEFACPDATVGWMAANILRTRTGRASPPYSVFSRRSQSAYCPAIVC